MTHRSPARSTRLVCANECSIYTAAYDGSVGCLARGWRARRSNARRNDAVMFPVMRAKRSEGGGDVCIEGAGGETSQVITRRKRRPDLRAIQGIGVQVPCMQYKKRTVRFTSDVFSADGEHYKVVQTLKTRGSRSGLTDREPTTLQRQTYRCTYHHLHFPVTVVMALLHVVAMQSG